MLLHACLLSLLIDVATAAPAAASSSVTQITATTTLTSVPQASSALSSLFNHKPVPTNIIAAYIEDGLTTLNLDQAIEVIKAPPAGPNNNQNQNTKNPYPPAFPKACTNDAPYDLTEEQLRGALYIPPTFQCGGSEGQPVILVPGTGTTGYLSFQGNYIPLLQNSSIADPVWLNIPGFLLDDAQTNAEYVAYAINYIYGICWRQVAVVAWSQGNIDAQWAYKYWPSTRSRVTDHIGFSPDYHGTASSSSGSSSSGAAPANVQQAYNSTFIRTLRADGGDAAYVPTTVVYSGFYDEVVEPQQGTNASAYLLSSTVAQASNNEVQLLCPHQSAGSFYTHEGTLYNALGFALLQDALSHEGPGNASRLDLSTICKNYLSPGLNLQDFQLTQDTIVIGGLSGELYPNKTKVEPAIKAYALNPPLNGTAASCGWSWGWKG